MKDTALSVLVLIVIGAVALGGLYIVLGYHGENGAVPQIWPGKAIMHPEQMSISAEIGPDMRVQRDDAMLKITPTDIAADLMPRKQVIRPLPVKKEKIRGEVKEQVNVTMQELWYGRYDRRMANWENEFGTVVIREGGEPQSFVITAPRAGCPPNNGPYKLMLLWIDEYGIYDWDTNGSTMAPGSSATVEGIDQAEADLRIVAILYCGNEPNLGNLPVVFGNADAQRLNDFFDLLEGVKEQDDVHVSTFST